MEAKKAKRLSHAQLQVARRIAAGTYHPMAMDGRTLRAMVADGFLEVIEGCPRTYTLTEAGRSALANQEAA